MSVALDDDIASVPNFLYDLRKSGWAIYAKYTIARLLQIWQIVQNVKMTFFRM